MGFISVEPTIVPSFYTCQTSTGCCVCGEMKYYAFTRNTKQVLFKVYVKGKMWAVAKVLYIVSNHTGPSVCAPGGRLSRRDLKNRRYFTGEKGMSRP